MVDVLIPDCILHDILARLPTKSLLRFKCVSKHCNRLILDPYFIKLRARRMILLPVSPFHVLDDGNFPLDYKSKLMFKPSFPFGNPKGKGIKCLGTVNGIVILVVKAYCVGDKSTYTRMILYNPFTSAYKLVTDPHCECYNTKHIYGFGYGATPDDLKIIRFSDREPSNYKSCRTFDVFSFKSNSRNRSINEIRGVRYTNDVGTFLNGYLHWIVYKFYRLMIMALNVDNMALSDIHGPRNYRYIKGPLLGTLHGCLCMVGMSYIGTDIAVWVMKEQGVWSNERWLTLLGLEAKSFKEFFFIGILDDGRVLMMNVFQQLIIFDTLKLSYKVLKISGSVKDLRGLTSIEYVESLASPSDLFVL